jgi:hypothetical protein
MDWKNLLNRFQFDDYFIVHDYVDLISAVELKAFVRDREIDLTREWHSAEMQFVTEGLFVGGFQQSGTELTMDFDRRANDRSGSRVLLVFDFSVSL